MTDPADWDPWKALADDLGLPPEPTAGSPVRAEELPPVESEEAPAARGRRRRAPTVEESTPVEIAPAEPIRADSEEAPVEIAPEEPVVSETAGEEAESAEESEASTRRRRRRGRRGGKGGTPSESGEEAPSAATEPTVEAPHAEQTDAEPTAGEEEQGPSRRRRRRRKKAGEGDGRAAAVAADELEDVPDDEPAPKEEKRVRIAGEDDELEDLSNWNGPSWNELIASLYRPPDR